MRVEDAWNPESSARGERWRARRRIDDQGSCDMVVACRHDMVHEDAGQELRARHKPRPNVQAAPRACNVTSAWAHLVRKLEVCRGKNTECLRCGHVDVPFAPLRGPAASCGRT